MPDRFTEVFLTWKFLGDETQSAPHTGARAKRHGDESLGVIPNPAYITRVKSSLHSANIFVLQKGWGTYHCLVDEVLSQFTPGLATNRSLTLEDFA